MDLRIWLVLFLTISILLMTAPPSPREPEIPPGFSVLQTRHLTVIYEAQFTKQKALYFAEGMEAAYQRLVIKQGFRSGARRFWLQGFPTSENPEHLRTVATHEFFHSVQLSYSLKLADRFLIEGTATWAMREVYPECVECYIEAFEDWLIGGTDASTLQHLGLGHHAGLFWNFISDHYGGAQLIRRLFEHPDIRLGVDWPKGLSALTGKPFLDLWAEFAAALAARRAPDAQWLYPRAEQKTPYVPVPVFVGEWTGQPLTIEQSNWENPYPQLCSEKRGGACPSKTSILSVGSNLAIRYPYGIHFLRITPKSTAPLALHVEVEKEHTSNFRIYLVARRASGAYEISPLKGECVLSKPMEYTLLQVVLTRGLEVPGKYQLRLQESQTPDSSLCRRG